MKINHAFGCNEKLLGSTGKIRHLGCPKGGFTTKIHVMGHARRNPLNAILTGGQTADVTQAYTLMDKVMGESYPNVIKLTK